MNHFHQDIGVACRKFVLEEIAGLESEAVRGDAGSLLNDVRLIEQHALGPRTSGEYGLKKMPATAADVANQLKPGKIVGCNDAMYLGSRFSGHGFVKDATRIGIFGQVIPETAGSHFFSTGWPVLTTLSSFAAAFQTGGRPNMRTNERIDCGSLVRNRRETGV